VWVCFRSVIDNNCVILCVRIDKNKSPGAEDAFKKVGEAYACLSDEDEVKYMCAFVCVYVCVC